MECRVARRTSTSRRQTSAATATHFHMPRFQRRRTPRRRVPISSSFITAANTDTDSGVCFVHWLAVEFDAVLVTSLQYDNLWCAECVTNESREMSRGDFKTRAVSLQTSQPFHHWQNSPGFYAYSCHPVWDSWIPTFAESSKIAYLLSPNGLFQAQNVPKRGLLGLHPGLHWGSLHIPCCQGVGGWDAPSQMPLPIPIPPLSVLLASQTFHARGTSDWSIFLICKS